MSLLADLLSNMVERGYRSLGRAAWTDRAIKDLARDLLGTTGEVSGMTLAREILERFGQMNDTQKLAFFAYVNETLDIDPTFVRDSLAAYQADRSKATYRAYMKAAEPQRQELIRRLNQVPGATAQLVAMRADLIRLMRDNPDLAALDLDFRHLFASWFNRGFLVLRPINWETPANILEKIIAYEAVHAITSWSDLRARVQPVDRRCFGFFHPAIPAEPLIFVEVALTRGIPGAIHDVLTENRETIHATNADTAVFYSISNCQAGLAGISFGNSLIKQVVEDLSRDLPNLKTFVTLSPIPGLTDWLTTQNRQIDVDDPIAVKSAAAEYLLLAKTPSGQPLDPVARFHLGNGASTHAIHAEADLSPNGQAQSAGAMVNYLYDLSRITQNHEGFATQALVAASSELRSLARQTQKTSS